MFWLARGWPVFSCTDHPHWPTFFSCHLYFCASNPFPVGLRTADVFPVGEKRRPEIRLLFAGYFPVGVKKVLSIDKKYKKTRTFRYLMFYNYFLQFIFYCDLILGHTRFTFLHKKFLQGIGKAALGTSSTKYIVILPSYKLPSV